MAPKSKYQTEIITPVPVFLQQFFRLSSDAAFVVDNMLQVLEWNGPLERLTGFLPSYAVGRPLRHLFLNGNFSELETAIQALEEGKKTAACNLTVAVPAGGAVVCQAHLFAVTDPETAFSGFVVLLKPISAHCTAAEPAAGTAECPETDLAARVANSAPCLMSVYDLAKNQLVYFNQQFGTFTGLTLKQEGLVGGSVFDQLVHPNDAGLFHKHFADTAALPDGEVNEAECRIKSQTGIWHWFLLRGSVFARDESGVATRLQTVLLNIEEPNRSEQQLERMLNNSLVGIVALDAVFSGNQKVTDFTFSFLNGAACSMLGIDAGSSKGASLMHVLSVRNCADYFSHYLAVMETGRPVVFEKKVTNGASTTWLSVTVSRLNQVLNVAFTDITRQKLTELALSESRNFIQKVTDATPVMLQVYDIGSGTGIFNNKGLRDFIAGRSGSELSVTSDEFIARYIHSDDVIRLRAFYTSFFAPGYTESSGNIRFRLRQADGTYRWCLSKNKIFKADTGGNPLVGISIIQDIDDLKKSKNLLQGVLNQSQNMILAFEAIRDNTGEITDFIYIHANATSQRFTGLKPEELVGASLRSFMTDDQAAERFAVYSRVVNSGIAADLEQCFELDFGQVWFHISVVKMDDGFVATFSDITNRKKAESELWESQQFIQKITDTAPFIITVFDVLQQKYVFRNRKLAEHLGYSPEKAALAEEDFLAGLVHPDDLARIPDHYEKLFALPDGEVAEVAFRVKDSTGEYRSMVARDTVFKRTPDGRIAAILGVSQDVNELERNKDLLAGVLNSSLSGIVVFQAKRNGKGQLTDFVFSLLNSVAEKMHDRTIICGTDCLLETWPYLAKDPLFDKLARVAETGVPMRQEYHYQPEIKRWFELSVTRLGDGIVLTYTDVTTRKESEDKVRKSEALLNEAQQIANLGIWEWDIPNDEISWTEAMYKMFELDPETDKVSFDTYLDMLDESDRFAIRQSIELGLSSREGYTFPHKIRFKDGRVKHLIGKGRVLLDGDNKPVRMLGTAMDITELIEIKQQLSEMLQLKSIGEAIPQIIWAARPDGFTDYVNQRWFEFTGLDEETMRSGEWTNLIHPDDGPRTWWNWKKALVSGEVFEMEFRMLRQDGVYRWLLARAVPMTDEWGKIIKWFGASTDIDDQKRTMEEMELIQEALSHYNKELSQKNEELHKINSDLDSFIYTASHDLKAPINNIEGLLDMLRSEMNTESELPGRVIELMEHSIFRFKNTLKDLSEISKVDRNLKEAVSQVHLPDLMDEIEADIEQLIRESNAVIRFDFEVNDLVFSRKNIRSILYNLLSNALKYRSLSRVPEVLVSSRLLADNKVQLMVSDNGLGLNEKDTTRVFEMFRRAHTHVEGSGVGLYIVKRIIENAGGKIEVESLLGTGTKFTVLLNQ